jgi:hypothetical protein
MKSSLPKFNYVFTEPWVDEQNAPNVIVLEITQIRKLYKEINSVQGQGQVGFFCLPIFGSDSGTVYFYVAPDSGSKSMGLWDARSGNVA